MGGSGAWGVDHYYTPNVKKAPGTIADHKQNPLTGQQLPTSRTNQLVPKVLCPWFPSWGLPPLEFPMREVSPRL